MEAWQWALVIAAAVVALAIVLLLAMRQRSRAQIRDRFGPEYERTLERHGDRRAAEIDLRDRARRREEIELRPLTDEARRRHREEWQHLQSRFVDEPEAAVAEADHLLDRVMGERGYPIDDEDHAALVSVDHPDVIEDYRVAREVRQRNATRLVSTEELRDAMLRFRSLFDRLLDGDATGTGAPGATRPTARGWSPQ